MDVTENDVYHPFIDIQDVPSVYYFSKLLDRPVKLNITRDGASSSPDLLQTSPSAIIDWFVKNGKVDRDELLQLLNV